MTYGLYDADLQYYPIPFYNLELMKLSSYYKRKREIVGLSPDFSPNRYNHFIVRQDFYNPNIISLKGNNIEYGGRAFDGNKYKPLPMEIEVMPPDISLYSKVPIPIKKKMPSFFSTMKRAEHIRLSLDGKNIWKDFEKQFRHDINAHGIIFHDYNLNEVNGAADFIIDNLPNWIAHKEGRRIGAKFPIQVNNKEDLCKWLSISPMGTFYSLQHNGLIDESYIPNLVELNLSYSIKKQVSVSIFDNFTYEQLISGGIRRIFRNIINLRSYGLFFPLIYNETFLIDENWRMVMKLINRYNEHLLIKGKKEYLKRVEPYETLFSYCKAAIKQYHIKEPLLSKESIQSIFQFVRETDYDLFKDFYEYRGGEVRNDR